MAHAEQNHFFQSVKGKHPDCFTDKKVIDCGSLDVNGSLKDLFTNCYYVGVDIAPGNNVDIVSTIHALNFKDETFDVVVSAEMFEHDEYWKESLQKMYDMCKKGGLIAISCAGKGRAEHGTTRTGAIWGTSNDYYMNIEPHHIQEIFTDNMFTSKEYQENQNTKDTYFYGIKV